MNDQFLFDQRLGISVPVLDKEWEQYSSAEQEKILLAWESYRADIPKRVKEIEKIIEQKQNELNDEELFARSCQLNQEIARLASTINELNIWYNIQQETNSKKHT